MSVLTPKRVFQVVVLFLSVAVSAYANNPSPRHLSRMVFDATMGEAVLFGGRGTVDTATGVAHSIDETWLLQGSRWSQRFPAVHPEGRSAHSMVYDSKRGRVILFGGFTDPEVTTGLPVFHNDTWAWQNGEWTKLEVGASPAARYSAGMAYDSDRDVVVLFGGIGYAADNKTNENLFDTWEFDGTSWHQLGVTSSGPKVAKPIMEYDPSRKQMLLVGVNESSAPVMYIQNPETSAWAAPSPAPEKLPTCTNEGAMAYQSHVQKIAFLGGICISDTPAADEVWEWNGSNWVKVTTTTVDRATGTAFYYDQLTSRITMFGGVTFGTTTPRSTVQTYANGLWGFNLITYRPRPRSLAGMSTTDPTTGEIWLYGGLNEYSSGYNGDFWRYAGNGQWHPILVEGTGSPTASCVTPQATFDSNRSRWILSCYGSELYEWDGATWKSFVNQNPEPNSRRFFSLAYDATLKKTVLFGGYDDASGNYRQDTWTWDGTKWAEVKNTRPPHRSNASMWFDPVVKKVVVYGGVGRPNLDTKVSRYDDMWSFDGNGWTKLTPATTPGPRLGAQFAVNPETNKVLLFGGLRAELAADNSTKRQFYDNDTWEWNGSTWTQLNPAVRPDVRENGAMAWDPVRKELILLAGYSGGFFRADLWVWDAANSNWKPLIFGNARRRASGQ